MDAKKKNRIDNIGKAYVGILITALASVQGIKLTINDSSYDEILKLQIQVESLEKQVKQANDNAVKFISDQNEWNKELIQKLDRIRTVNYRNKQ